MIGGSRLARYEDLTSRLKQLINKEKLNLRLVKTMVANEIEQKNMLEKCLRMCVDDVQAEIQKKKSEQKNSYCKFPPHSLIRVDNRSKRGHAGYFEEKSYTALEKDKIIEVLLS